MRSALYYPHTKIQSERLLKTALLFWDNLYVIVPWVGYQPLYDLPQANEAFSIVGRCHYPGDDEKKRAHDAVKDFLKRPLPQHFHILLLTTILTPTTCIHRNCFLTQSRCFTNAVCLRPWGVGICVPPLRLA